MAIFINYHILAYPIFSLSIQISQSYIANFTMLSSYFLYFTSVFL